MTMAGHGEKETRLRERAIAALLAEPSIKAAAKTARVSHAALKLWLKDEAFLKDFREARLRVLERAVALLAGSTTRAVQALRRNLRCGRPADEIRAATAILEHATRGAADLLDHEGRLRALEEQARD
jgi:hypothetical protein